MTEELDLQEKVGTNEEETQDITADELFLLSNYKVFKEKCKGMSKEDFVKECNLLRFYQLCLVLKHNCPQIYLDGKLEDMTYDRISNLLNNFGFVTSYNETTRKWQCPISPRGALLVIYDENSALAALRTAIFKYSGGQIHYGQYFHNTDIIDTLTHTWQKANNTDVDPFKFGVEDAERAAKAIGTTLADVEAKVKELEGSKTIN